MTWLNLYQVDYENHLRINVAIVQINKFFPFQRIVSMIMAYLSKSTCHLIISGFFWFFVRFLETAKAVIVFIIKTTFWWIKTSSSLPSKSNF